MGIGLTMQNFSCEMITCHNSWGESSYSYLSILLQIISFGALNIKHVNKTTVGEFRGVCEWYNRTSSHLLGSCDSGTEDYHVYAFSETSASH